MWRDDTTTDDNDVRVMGACEHGTFNIAYRRAHWGMHWSYRHLLALDWASDKKLLGLGLDFSSNMNDTMLMTTQQHRLITITTPLCT